MKRKMHPHFGPIRGSLDESGFLNLRACIAILLCALAGCWVLSATPLAFFSPQASLQLSEKTLSFAERVTYQRAIEDVYWRHRIWPRNRGENPDPKPSLDKVMTQAQLEMKVAEYLGNSQALGDYWKRPITAEQLQAEMDRMAQHTKLPEVLHELFEALGNDPFVIAECLARPVLADRLLTRSVADQVKEISLTSSEIVAAASYTLPTISDGASGCTNDTWAATTTANAPSARYSHTAVWTGTEMIVWGGGDAFNLWNIGGRYNPSTDSWRATSTINAPSARADHTAVWNGTEMIIWGGNNLGGNLTTGGRYNPSTNSWRATSTTNAPSARRGHTAVWTGSEMIVWGSYDYATTGGRYNPGTDSWTSTSTTNAPSRRQFFTAVWTGNEMIVWGGFNGTSFLNTGRRYNPGTDSWVATSTSNAPSGRETHTAVWTGSERIVWSGDSDGSDVSTGGRYTPDTNSWTATSTTNAPSGRELHTAVWTGAEMIVWGGGHTTSLLNTGGRYNPSIDS